MSYINAVKKMLFFFTLQGINFPLLERICYNSGHNILRLFDVLPNFSFTTSETNRDY